MEVNLYAFCFLIESMFEFGFVFSLRFGQNFIVVFAAGHQPAADHILDPFEFFGSMVGWFHGSMVPWFDGHL